MNWPTIMTSLTAISILEAASHNYIKLLGVGPELVLIGVIFFSLNSDRQKGALCGFIGGFLEMVFSGMHPLVLLLYGCVGFVTGMHKEALYKHLASAQMILAAIAVLYSSLIYDILLSSKGFPYYKAVLFFSVPAAIYTALVAPLIFKVLESIMPSTEIDYKEITFKKKIFEGRRPQ